MLPIVGLNFNVNTSGFRPSLDLAFSNMGTLDPRITFTRASSALGVGASLEYEVFAEDVARLVYDPATGESLGLLIEPQATNILLNSDAPATQSVTVSNATVYTLACYGSGSLEVTAGGAGTATNGSPLIFTTNATTVTVTVTGSPDYFQLEIGSVATSPIITAGSQATRAADVAVMTGTNFSDWYSEASGTLVVEAMTPEVGSSSPFAYTVSDGTDNNRTITCAATQFHFLIVSGGGISINADMGAFVNNQFSKVAGAYAEDDFAASLDGSAVSTSSSGSPPVSPDRINFGASSNGTVFGVTYLKSLSFYPARLSNATLQALTGA